MSDIWVRLPAAPSVSASMSHLFKMRFNNLLCMFYIFQPLYPSASLRTSPHKPIRCYNALHLLMNNLISSHKPELLHADESGVDLSFFSYSGSDPSNEVR